MNSKNVLTFQEAITLCEKEGKKVRAKCWLKAYYIEYNEYEKTFYLVNGSHKELFKFKVDYFYEEFELHTTHAIKVKKYLRFEEILPNLYLGKELYSTKMQKDMYLKYYPSEGVVSLVGNTGRDVNHADAYVKLLDGNWYILVDEEDF